MVLSFVLTIALIALAAVVGGLWYAHRKLYIEASLKQEMLTRGMSAEEIKEVLAATRWNHGSLAGLDEGVAKAKIDSETKQKQAELDLERVKVEASLKQAMINRGMSVDEIRDVLEARFAGEQGNCAAPKTPLKEVFDFVKGFKH
jgi:hypothetical protein